LFSPKEGESAVYRVSTPKELADLQADEEFASSDKKLRLVEVMMDRQDAPRALREQASIVSTPPVLSSPEERILNYA
jgi:TPP-dependent 2-oxoacid decarboxylase